LTVFAIEQVCTSMPNIAHGTDRLYTVVPVEKSGMAEAVGHPLLSWCQAEKNSDNGIGVAVDARPTTDGVLLFGDSIVSLPSRVALPSWV